MVIEPAKKFHRHAVRQGRQFLSIWFTGAVWLLAPVSLFAGNYFQGVAPASVGWPGGIVPYRFDTNYVVTTTESNAIVSGLREWELAANVKFVPYTNQANYVRLQFTNDGSGTGYYLSGAPATMMLHGLARGLMCHEAGHLFGLQHEHQRNDRNNYITVNYANVLGGTNGESAFTIDTNSTSFGAYDLVSVMHYGPDTFTNGLGDALDPLPAYEKFYHKLGNLALSIGDRAAVSNLYGAPLTPLTNVVTTTADGGFGSLRAAIYYANDHPGTTIKFKISTSDSGYANGVFTISLLGELPPLVSAGTIIDGTTQTGFTNHPVIVVDGSQVSPEAGDVSGLHFYGTNSTARALAFDNFPYAGVQLFCPDATGNHVENCYLGLKSDGTNAAPNFNAGIFFQFGAHNNFIGGIYATQRNVISGNSYYGVLINDTNSDANVILGNYLGLDASGRFAVPNGYSGVGIWDGPHGTVVGGTNAGAGNVLSGNGQYGIYLSDANVSGTTIQGNFIGTDFIGSNSVPNGDAITNSYAGIGIFSGANGNLIGGTNALARNLISGNTNVGVYLAGAGVTNNVIEGNYIGLNISGTAALPSQGYGIYLIGGASGNTVGGASPGALNAISGNRLYGVFISDPGTSNNLVENNFIGTSAAGTNAVPVSNIGVGIFNGATANVIGAGNVISGNLQYGVDISDPGTSNNVVLGNLIGTDVTGTNAIGNADFGIGLWSGASGNVIGGTTAAARNVISGTTGYGYGITLGGAIGNVVEGNYIGTDITGKNAIPNFFSGVALYSAAANNVIGGTAGAGNLISGNYSYGVYISGQGTTNNWIQGNAIGTDATGTNALPNFAGVIDFGGTTNNTIGLKPDGSGSGNQIAFNYADGVQVGTNSVGIAIRGNSIFNNGNLGINLVDGGNGLQNSPVITNAFGSGGSTIVLGKLNSAPGGGFFIDVYRNTAAGGQGQFYLGTVSVTTDGSGNASFSLTNTAANYAGQYFTATATSVGGDTSEFSADVLATNQISSSPSASFTGPLQWRTNGFVFSLALVTNFNYHLQAATNLASPVAWIDLTNFLAISPSLTFTDRLATNYRVRFYRVASP